MTHKRISDKVLGKYPVRTVIQLVIASIFVGAIFRFFGLGPREFWSGLLNGLRNLISEIGESAVEIFITILTYFAIGAAIVVPIWILSRLIKAPSAKKSDRQPEDRA